MILFLQFHQNHQIGSMRKENLKTVKRIVIKIGSRVITGDKNGIDRDFLQSLARDVASSVKTARR
jgi:glutamate 5-kinase